MSCVFLGAPVEFEKDGRRLSLSAVRSGVSACPARLDRRGRCGLVVGEKDGRRQI
jgi:hypothetical protein